MEIIDYLLARKKAGGGSDVTIEQLSVTENGTYSEQGIAYSPVVVNVPAPENSYQLKDVPAGTVSTIEDGTDLPMPSLKVGIEPAQDLHGYDHPWVGGAGKNLLQMKATSQTIAGVTISVKDDGTFIANGTATENIALILSRKNINDTPLPEGQLAMTGCPSGGSTSSYYLTCWRTNSGNANDIGGGVTFGYRSDWDFVVSLVIASGTTCNNLIFKPMIRLATETDATFAPYSNICPISGWDECNVVVSPTTDAEDGTTYTIQFRDGDNPLTVYGGTLDVTTGELVVDRAEVDLGDLTWIGSAERFNSNGIANFAKTYPDGVPNKVIFEKYQSKPSRIGGYYPNEPNVVSLNYNGNLYSVSETIPTGQCVYELLTPQTYHLSPTQVRTLVGTNNIWADTGNIIEGKYFRSLT